MQFGTIVILGITPAYAGNTDTKNLRLVLIQDHPRIRGEYFNHISYFFFCLGSPPHTRGIPSEYSVKTLYDGITPAYAGNTIKTVQMFGFLWDHPRIRGEYSFQYITTVICAGSPPHTRGILHKFPYHLLCHGITPAYAGNTTFPTPSPASVWDHPRIRGEYPMRQSNAATLLGSPPHTRGILKNVNIFPQIVGITPAYAGNTYKGSRSQRGERDHPRIRGEYFTATGDIVANLGSPPHTRGIRRDHLWLCPELGITPAYAGNTIASCYGGGTNGDHPRIRGEYRDSKGGMGVCEGSPPHTRGILNHCGTLRGRCGITPAYAGNTPDSGTELRRNRDHPRIRGEYEL